MPEKEALRLVARCRGREEWLSSELRQILDALPILVFVAEDPFCNSMFGNYATERLLHTSPGANISKSSPYAEEPRRFEVYDADGQHLTPAEMPVQRAARGEEVTGVEIEFRFVDGQRVWLIGNAVPLRDPHGGIWGSVGAFSDITAQKSAERALVMANEAKSHFLAAASHDLRQPLQAVRMFIDILTEGAAEGKQRVVIELADKALNGAEALLHALLDMSKLDAGLVKVELQPTAYAEIAAELLAEYKDLARSKSLQITIMPSAAIIETDPIILVRLLRNLLDNAIKYTERGRILLGCRRLNRALRIEVWDTGPGIPPSALEAIFEDFYQVGNPNRDSARGLGIGLGVVRRKAELLGHQLSVRSWPGKGSVFAVTVPLAHQPTGLPTP